MKTRWRGTHAWRTWEGGATWGTHHTWRGRKASTRRKGWTCLGNIYFRVEKGRRERGAYEILEARQNQEALQTQVHSA